MALLHTRQCCFASHTSALNCRPSPSAATAKLSRFCSGSRLRRAASNGSKCNAFFNRFRPSSTEAGIYGSQSRDDYNSDDVEQYFNYMGMLATEGTYDRMEAMIDGGIHPADILLLWASAEGDTPKVAEMLRAGADFSAKDLDGKTPLDVAANADVQELLQNPKKAESYVAP